MSVMLTVGHTCIRTVYRVGENHFRRISLCVLLVLNCDYQNISCQSMTRNHCYVNKNSFIDR